MGKTKGPVSAAARRVVLDTNVVASALLFPSAPAAMIRDAWKSGTITPLVCRVTTLELICVLAYPRFGLSDREHKEFVDEYLQFTEVVDVTEGTRRGPECRDPDDQVFIELAIAASAECIVSGDKALLALDAHGGLMVRSLAEFASMLRMDTT